MLVGVEACRRSEPPTPDALKPAQGSPTARSTAAPPEDGQWVMPGKDYGGTRYSGLAQINTGNVANLRPVITFSTGVLRGHEAAPIVAGNTMFIVTPYPNIVYALDLTKPGAPINWSFRPNPAESSQGVACCDVVNRGATYDAGKIFFNTLDGQTIALDANSGKVVWRVQYANIQIGESMTMAPLVADGKVFVGNSGGEMGVRGWTRALDENSGKLLWTAYHTGPDQDALIGPEFKPFYAKDRGTNLGVSSWPSGMWKTGGGTQWGFISYDPALDLIYYGTSNPGPWNPDVRPGDNKWTSTLFARRASDGHAVWAYQVTPHDSHDYDGVNESVLVDIDWRGARRKVLMHPDRDGYLYVIDRTTGQVLSADPYGYITSTTGVDLQSGELKYNPALKLVAGKVTRGVCPATAGVKDWQPSAYSFHTGLLYVPVLNLCMDQTPLQANYIAGTPYVGMDVKMYAGPGGHRGAFEAWDPVAGKIVWTVDEDLPVFSGALATAGDVVFYGTLDGWFKAVDARPQSNGKVLWQYKLGSGINAQPVTYRGPDGKQYVAVLSGIGGLAGAIVAGDLDSRDSSAGAGFANAVRDLPKRTAKGGMLYVFALP